MTSPAPDSPSPSTPDDGAPRHRGPGLGLVAGLVLLAIGAMMFARHAGWSGGQPMGWHGEWQGAWHMTGHWWAALLLIPGVGLLVRAIRHHRAGMAGAPVFGPTLVGTVLSVMALSLFFGFGGHVFGPAILIAIGAVLFARSRQRRFG